MGSLLKAHKVELLCILAVIVLYFVLRLPNLTLQPIFADEAIYIRWAQVMRAEQTLRFLPLSDGKTPLFMWLMMPLFKVFDDPLLAGRFLSVISGFLTLSGTFFLGRKLFGVQAGLWAALLIAVTPFIVFFDRMALVDSLLSAFSVWALIFSLLIVEHSRLDLAMFLGYMLGGGLLTKTPGFFNVVVLPTSLAIFNWGAKDRQQRLLKLSGLWVVTMVITFAIYNILRLGPGFSNLSARNQDYIFSPIDLIGRPFDPFIPHIKDLADWLPKLLTLPVLVLVILGGVLAVAKRERYALAILLWSMIPLMIEVALLRTFTARYILFSVPPLLVLAGWVISLLTQKIKVRSLVAMIISLVILLPLPLYFDVKLINDPANAPLPREERRGYLEDWTAGYGLNKVAQSLMLESEKGLVVVGTEGSFGTLPDGLQIYLDKHSHQAPPNKQILVVGGKATISAQLRAAASEHPTFFVANKSRFPFFASGLTLLEEYPKAKGPDLPQDSILFFRVLPE